MKLESSLSQRWFARFATGLLVYNIPVILWGAYVRASFSGDGCGAHWPFCNGQVIPQQMAARTLIEFTHRLMTSVDCVAVAALCVWAFLAFPRPHPVRRASLFSLLFLLVEALLGAGLVLFRLVAKDQSAGRVWYLSAHLTNTMLLLAALTTTAWLAYSHRERLQWPSTSRQLRGACLVAVIVSVTGAMAALGDTLAPAASLSAGMQQDFSSAGSFLVKLRLFHPFAAISGAAYIIWRASKWLNVPPTKAAAVRVIGITLFQVAVGAMNLTLLAPIWMQLFHLLVADVLWISLIVLVLRTSAVLEVEAGSVHGREHSGKFSITSV